MDKSKIKSKKIFKKKDAMKILNIGRFVDQKDQITFLKALNQIKNKINFEAILVGRGKDEHKLKKYILQNNLNKKITILEFSKNPYATIKQCELLVLSSKYEGLQMCY